MVRGSGKTYWRGWFCLDGFYFKKCVWVGVWSLGFGGGVYNVWISFKGYYGSSGDERYRPNHRPAKGSDKHAGFANGRGGHEITCDG